MLFLVVSAVLVGFAYGACPGGWEHDRSWCFLISRDNLTMPGAMTVCELLGGTLAVVDSSNTQDFLQKKLNESKYSAGGAFWIDGNDQAVEGTWVNNKQLNLTYTNWGRSQPNNLEGSENCVTIRRNFNFNYKWTDDPCGVEFNYICQRSFVSGAGLVG